MPAPVAIIGMIPWSKLIENAPTIFEQAQKLISLARSSGGDKAASREADRALPDPGRGIDDRIDVAIVNLETSVRELDTELIAASGLIGGLAEANQGLIGQIRILKRGLVAVGALGIIGIVIALVALFS